MLFNVNSSHPQHDPEEHTVHWRRRKFFSGALEEGEGGGGVKLPPPPGGGGVLVTILVFYCGPGLIPMLPLVHAPLNTYQARQQEPDRHQDYASPDRQVMDPRP